MRGCSLPLSNEKWTAHAADEEFGSETEAEMRGTIEDMKVGGNCTSKGADCVSTGGARNTALPTGGTHA